MSSLNETPRSGRIHIGLYGRRNSGKSTLLNAIVGHEAAVVSDVAGTTTDPVYKSMELAGIGPCVFIDTAGFDDEGELGALRIKQTEKALVKTDIALLLFGEDGDGWQLEKEWLAQLRRQNTPVIAVVNKSDALADAAALRAAVLAECGIEPLAVSAKERQGIVAIREALLKIVAANETTRQIVGDLAAAGDVVLLVMPQDIQAPKGRLILPQVQVLRELLDKKCLVMSATTDGLAAALGALACPPSLIITDSQVFAQVYAAKPPESKLTSFSVLMAGYKGDIEYFKRGAAVIDALTPRSKVLIAEACTHAPLAEDIGRVKLPRLLRRRVGEQLTVEVVSGGDFPADVTGYDLIIHCGACMFNRQHVMSRLEQARRQGVPMTNYGVAIAYLQGILDKISCG